MCGIVFFYANQLGSHTAKERITYSLDALAHRGPDACTTIEAAPAHFAHARLAIVDLTDSNQPMQSPDGRYTLIFNGEIYNHYRLRDQLSGKWKFQTQGDTEVLLAGLIEKGIRFLPELEGMWAFALWDSTKRELLLSRDRMGKKPLFYFREGDQFSCGSELPSLRFLATNPWQEDLDSTADYFRYGYPLPGYTAWKDVFEVLPGHWLKWSPGSAPTEEPYWQLPLPGRGNSAFSDEDLRYQLGEAVRKRLVADVEVGAFLSGGIDSSIICALAQHQMSQKLKTYTIGFTESAFDETKFAAQVAHHIGTEHHSEIFSDWEESKLEALLSKHVGQPFADASLLPTALVSQLAARDVKVALSGDGADELFGGYQRYQARIILRWYTRLPLSLRSGVERAIRALPEPTAHHSRSLLKKAYLFSDIAQRHQSEKPYTAPLMFDSNHFASLFPELVGRGHTPRNLKDQTELDDLQQMLYRDSLIYLPQDIHTKVDRASMAASLETRAPFMDHKVVELAFSRPANKHLRIGSGKLWLRSAFNDLLPDSIWKRRKQGFGVPLHDWFRGKLGVRLESCLMASMAPINKNVAMQLIQQHQSGKRDHGYRLWMLYVYLATNHS
ncbi:asparagine synthase (glutamine-hydrolyzing) [Marinobacter sp. KM021]|uniref:asparagine synthase (glutamine-hydrolyzing) n=1 Tax=Marinobacter sp. KM021 TaxID=3075616 RepID=UPI003D6BB35D